MTARKRRSGPATAAESDHPATHRRKLDVALTIGDLFEDAADLCGNRTALVSGARSVCHTELDADTNRRAS
jgi:hypothetical protein